MRLVADSIRAMNPERALTHLDAMPKAASKPLSQVIRSALANAKEKNAKAQNVTFLTIEVMEGPVMKRWRAVSRGTAHGYKKRMTHIRVVLTDEGKI